MLLKLLPDKWVVDPRPLRFVGMFMLAASITWSRFAPASLTEDARDASQGFMVGISLSLLIWSLVIQKRARR